MNQWLEKLYAEHRQGLFTSALSIVGSPDVAEDAVQIAFAKLYGNPGAQDFVGKNGNAVSYVFQTVRNAAIDLCRADQRQRKLSASIFAEHRNRGNLESPPERLLTKERDALLRTAIDQLDDPDREAIVLKLFAGLTFEQAGSVTGTSPKTIATRYRRALRKLEIQLKAKYEFRT